MDFGEVANYAMNGLALATAGSLAYAGTLLAINLPYLKSKRINSEDEFFEIAQEEAEKRGVDNSRLLLAFGKDIPTESRKEGENLYSLSVRDHPFFANRATVSHEMAHIANGDCDKPWNFFRHYFRNEPRALVQGLKGLKK